MSYLLISLLCLKLPLHNYLNCTLPLLSIPLQTLPKKQLRPVPSPCPASQSSHNHYLFSSFTYATFSPWPTFLSLDLFSFPFHWQIFFTSTYFHFSLTHFLFIDPFFFSDKFPLPRPISFHRQNIISLTHFLFTDRFSLPFSVLRPIFSSLARWPLRIGSSTFPEANTTHPLLQDHAVFPPPPAPPGLLHGPLPLRVRVHHAQGRSQ